MQRLGLGDLHAQRNTPAMHAIEYALMGYGRGSVVVTTSHRLPSGRVMDGAIGWR